MFMLQVGKQTRAQLNDSLPCIQSDLSSLCLRVDGAKFEVILHKFYFLLDSQVQERISLSPLMIDTRVSRRGLKRIKIRLEVENESLEILGGCC